MVATPALSVPSLRVGWLKKPILAQFLMLGMDAVFQYPLFGSVG